MEDDDLIPTEDELLDELAANYISNQKRPGEIAVAELLDRLHAQGIAATKETVRGYLEKLVNNGEMEKRGGRGATAYYRRKTLGIP